MADTDLALHDDVEKVAYKNGNSSDETYPAPQYDKDAQAQISSVTTHHDGFFSAFTPNSFKRNPIARVVTEATDQSPSRPATRGACVGHEAQTTPSSDDCNWRFNWCVAIQISAGINLTYLSGTGLLVGSGSALATGGPASLIVAYGLIGGMLFCTVHALGELAVAFPIAGAFSVYSSRFIDPAWGFAMGWK
jgi:amino acid transporter